MRKIAVQVSYDQGHDFLWFKYKETTLPIEELFKDAKNRWPKDKKLPKAMYLLELGENGDFFQKDNKCGKICGYDNRDKNKEIINSYFVKFGAERVSTI